MQDRVGDRGFSSHRSVPPGWLEVMGHARTQHQDVGSGLGLVIQPGVPTPSPWLSPPTLQPEDIQRDSAPFQHPPLMYPIPIPHPSAHSGFSLISARILDPAPSQHPILIQSHPSNPLDVSPS